MNNLLFLIAISRPYGWLIAPFVFLIGLFYSGTGFRYSALPELITLTFPISLLLFGLNDLYDFESDKLNPRKKRIEFDSSERRLILIGSTVSAVLLLLSSVVSYSPGNAGLMIILLLLSWAYSSPPIRLKERPPLDSLSNGVLFFLVFSLGWSFGGPISEIPLKIYFVSLCVAAIHAYASIMDYSADKKAGYKTFAVVTGKRLTALISAAVFVIASVFAGIERVYLNYYFIFCAILILVSFIYPSEKLAYSLFRLIFAGFVVASVLFLIPFIL